VELEPPSQFVDFVLDSRSPSERLQHTLSIGLRSDSVFGEYGLGLVQCGIEVTDQPPPFSFERVISRIDGTTCAALSVSLCCVLKGSLQMVEDGIKVLYIVSEVLVSHVYGVRLSDVLSGLCSLFKLTSAILMDEAILPNPFQRL
jgi:hypothetical protein